jgi:hypothetical protein
MKKSLLLILLSFSLFFSINNYTYSGNCNYDFDSWSTDIWKSLDECLNGSNLVNWNNVTIDWAWWFEIKIKNWVYNLSIYLWVFAVWSIVYWSLRMTLSAWEDEKIKKSKDIIKWWIIWFIWLVSVSAVINLVVKIMYSI